MTFVVQKQDGTLVQPVMFFLPEDTFTLTLDEAAAAAWRAGKEGCTMNLGQLVDDEPEPLPDHVVS